MYEVQCVRHGRVTRSTSFISEERRAVELAGTYLEDGADEALVFDGVRMIARLKRDEPEPVAVMVTDPDPSAVALLKEIFMDPAALAAEREPELHTGQYL